MEAAEEILCSQFRSSERERKIKLVSQLSSGERRYIGQCTSSSQKESCPFSSETTIVFSKMFRLLQELTEKYLSEKACVFSYNQPIRADTCDSREYEFRRKNSQSNH